MMIKCPKCGKLFNRTNKPICIECIKAEGEMFEKVRLFIKETKITDLDEVIEETGATKKQLLRWVREGKIDLVLPDGDSLTCSKCGKVITKGRMCKKCAEKMTNRIGGVIATQDQAPKKKSNIIHVTERRK